MVRARKAEDVSQLLGAFVPADGVLVPAWGRGTHPMTGCEDGKPSGTRKSPASPGTSSHCLTACLTAGTRAEPPAAAAGTTPCAGVMPCAGAGDASSAAAALGHQWGSSGS